MPSRPSPDPFPSLSFAQVIECIAFAPRGMAAWPKPEAHLRERGGGGEVGTDGAAVSHSYPAGTDLTEQRARRDALNYSATRSFEESSVPLAPAKPPEGDQSDQHDDQPDHEAP